MYYKSIANLTSLCRDISDETWHKAIKSYSHRPVHRYEDVVNHCFKRLSRGENEMEEEMDYTITVKKMEHGNWKAEIHSHTNCNGPLLDAVVDESASDALAKVSCIIFDWEKTEKAKAEKRKALEELENE